MNKELQMEMRLWDYIDGTAAAAERDAIERLIKDNTEWRAKYGELLEVHQMLRFTELEQPSMRFAKNVMDEIAKYHIAPATKTYINKKIIWSIGLFFITLIASLLLYGFVQVDWSAGSNAQGGPNIDFSKIDYSPLFNNTFVNGFMMLNVVLGLMLLDRFLNRKKHPVQKPY